MLLASHKYEYGVSLPYHDDLRRSVNWLLCNTYSLVLGQHYTLCETELGSRISTFFVL